MRHSTCAVETVPRSAICSFFFNDRATPEIYPLSLPDALPICFTEVTSYSSNFAPPVSGCGEAEFLLRDRKSTRLNSRHLVISYALFCFKKSTTNQGRGHAARADDARPSSAGTPPADQARTGERGHPPAAGAVAADGLGLLSFFLNQADHRAPPPSPRGRVSGD